MAAAKQEGRSWASAGASAEGDRHENRVNNATEAEGGSPNACNSDPRDLGVRALLVGLRPE